MSKLNIVLLEPEIPQNTGNIARTCAATDASLHMIEPFGFKIDDSKLKRAGMDYLVGFSFEYYDSYEEFVCKNNNPSIYYITRYGKKAPSDVDFSNVVKQTCCVEP